MRSAPDRSARRPPRSTDGPSLGAPIFVLNLKTYPAVLGAGALVVARQLADAGRTAGVQVALAPATSDLAAVAGLGLLPVLAQHVDPVDAGPTTGFVPVAALTAGGARGSLVNHSEHPLSRAEVGAVTARLGAAGLSAVVCARDARIAGQLARLHPPYVAVEPPELIGGDRAVSTARPEVIVASVRTVRAASPTSRLLCGAGIRGRADVRRALELGAEGILVASAVALAPRPRDAIVELLSGF
jgi:triosephosphate isomerase (TIM)